MTDENTPDSRVESSASLGSELYQRQIANCDNELMHKVWDGTPWMADAYIGSYYTDGRREEIMQWCREHFGSEAWPIHGKPGDWHSGGTSINGWQWMGFKTEEQMQKFIARWPAPNTESSRAAAKDGQHEHE